MPMPKLNWMWHLFSLAFLHSCLQYQALDGNKATPLSNMMTHTAYNCSCYDGKGRIYNLAPLQRKDGPRFTVSNAGLKYSYNPCRSFSLAQERNGKHNCSNGDVAVCKWVDGGSHEKIGSQSFFQCSSEAEHKPPQLIYSISKNRRDWKVIIKLKCNQSLLGDDDGNFDFIDAYGSYKFRLTHNCACPNGCPKPTTTTPTTFTTKSPIEWKEIVMAVSGGIFLLIIFLCLVWLKLKRQNNEEYERQRLIDEEGNVEHNNLDDGRRTENLSQPLMSVSSRSRSDNMESATKIKNKDIFKVGSVPV